LLAIPIWALGRGKPLNCTSRVTSVRLALPTPMPLMFYAAGIPDELHLPLEHAILDIWLFGRIFGTLEPHNGSHMPGIVTRADCLLWPLRHDRLHAFEHAPPEAMYIYGTGCWLHEVLKGVDPTSLSMEAAPRERLFGAVHSRLASFQAGWHAPRPQLGPLGDVGMGQRLRNDIEAGASEQRMHSEAMQTSVSAWTHSESNLAQHLITGYYHATQWRAFGSGLMGQLGPHVALAQTCKSAFRA
jgi:hypothetical protein